MYWRNEDWSNDNNQYGDLTRGVRDERINVYFDAKVKSGNTYHWINLGQADFDSFYNNNERCKQIFDKVISEYKDRTDNWFYLENHEVMPQSMFKGRYTQFFPILIETLEKYNQMDKFKLIDIDLADGPEVEYKRKFPFYEPLPLMIGETNGGHSKLPYKYILDKKPPMQNKEFKKKFTCLMHREREERKLMFSYLHRSGVVDRTWLSYGINHPLNSRFTKLPKEVDFPFNWNFRYPFWNLHHRNGISNTYIDSFCHIVMESKWDEHMQLTEKLDIPLFTLQPFVVVGPKGMLKKLRELGFKTFGNFWDESYDEEEDKMARLEKVFDVITYIDKQFGSGQDSLEECWNSMLPILKHNYELNTKLWQTKHKWYYKEPLYDLLEVPFDGGEIKELKFG